MARAIDTRCFWPPDNVIPLSPKIVSYCLLKLMFYEQQHFGSSFNFVISGIFFTKFDIIFYAIRK
jgi:hypothetical protein